MARPGTFAKGNPGRKQGSSNKTTTAARDAIALAAEGLGGTKRLIAWAKSDEKNETIFWSSIYPRLVPLDVSGKLEHELTIVLGALGGA